MRSNLDHPSLVIAYSPSFTLQITCTRAQQYTKAGMPGVKDYFFAIDAKIRLATGHFEYHANDICFEVAGVERFLQSLMEIRDGRSRHAKLSEVGEMFVLGLELKERRLRCSIDIREFQPGDLTTLHSGGIDVDYDLFVNKLSEQIREFVASLKDVTPEDV